ncbi:MAG: 16S rRNA processing protein RimM [Anaerolineae bacterium]|nr:16S rRNA processing protein RimM [Anaerolineae bacterium]
MAETPKYLQIAKVLKPHGIRGDVRVQVLTGYPERMIDLEKVFIGPAPESYRASKQDLSRYQITRAARDKNNQWLIHLKGIDDRDAAEPLRDMYVFVAIEDAVPLEENEYYLFQLVGLQVQTTEGEALGKLTDVMETGANDVFIVKGEAYGEVLIPVIDGVIQNVDLEAQIVTVALPDGLLSPEE